jgi:hypothetical protein
MRRARVPVAAIVLLLLVGCASGGGGALRPGAANAFDAIVYDTLLVAQAAIEQAKSEAVTRDEALAVNLVIHAYNAAERSYRIYHEAAKSGPTDIATIAVQLAALIEQVWPWLDPESRAKMAPWLVPEVAP